MKANSFAIRSIGYRKENQAYIVRFKYSNGRGEEIGNDGCEITVRLKADSTLEEKARSVKR